MGVWRCSCTSHAGWWWGTSPGMRYTRRMLPCCGRKWDGRRILPNNGNSRGVLPLVPPIPLGNHARVMPAQEGSQLPGGGRPRKGRHQKLPTFPGELRIIILSTESSGCLQILRNHPHPIPDLLNLSWGWRPASAFLSNILVIFVPAYI